MESWSRCALGNGDCSGHLVQEVRTGAGGPSLYGGKLIGIGHLAGEAQVVGYFPVRTVKVKA